MKKKLILHVGTHKTGSTSLQNFFLANKDYLRLNGILYPTTKYHPVGQQRLAYAFNEEVSPHLRDVDNEVIGVFDELNELIDNTSFECMVVSSENFAPNGDLDVIRKIKDFFYRFDVAIVIYIRRQDKYLQSIYRECVKLPNSFPGRFEDFRSPHPLNYCDIIGAWQSVFGPENVVVKSYDYAVKVEKGIVQSFINCFPGIFDCLIDVSKDSKGYNSNETLSNVALELIRAGNLSDISISSRGNFNSHIRNFVRLSGLDDIWDFGIPVGFMSELLQVNNRIFREYFHGEDLFYLDEVVARGKVGHYHECDIYREYMRYSRSMPYYNTNEFRVFRESIERNFSIQ